MNHILTATILVVPFIFWIMPGEFEDNSKRLVLSVLFAGLASYSIIRYRFIRLNIFTCLISLMAAVFWTISYFWATVPEHVLLPALQLVYLAVVCQVVSQASDRKFINRACFACFCVAIMASIVGLLQKYAGFNLVPQLVIPAITFSNKNMAAEFITIILPMALGFTRGSIMSSFILLIPTWAYLIVADARGAQLVSCCSTAVWLVLERPWQRRRLAFIGGVIGIIILFLTIQPERTWRRALDVAAVSDNSTTTYMRITWWSNGLGMFMEHPLTGVGLGNFKIIYPLYCNYFRTDPLFREDLQLTRLHNDHLQTLCETGMIGMFAYLSVIVALIMSTITLSFKVRWRQLAYVHGSAWAYLAVAAFSFPGERIMHVTMYGVALGIIGRYQDWSIKLRPGVLVRSSIACILVIVMALFFTVTWLTVKTDNAFVVVGMNDRNMDLANEALTWSVFTYGYGNFNIPSLLGRNLMLQGKDDEALYAYGLALRAHPYNFGALTNTGYVMVKKGNYLQALEFFKMAYRIMPSNPVVSNNMGLCYFSLGDDRQAEDCFLRAIKLNSKYIEPVVGMANLAVRRKENNVALSWYERALEIEPQRKDLQEYYNLIKERTYYGYRDPRDQSSIQQNSGRVPVPDRKRPTKTPRRNADG